MANRICPFDGKEFSSGNSYRVHKSKKHRGETPPQSNNISVEPAPTIEAEVPEPEVIEEPQPASNPEVEEQTEKVGSGSGWIWLIGGVVGLALLFFFLRGKPPEGS
jgi:hypothetical protein